MQTVSDLYARIWRTYQHKKEHRAIINGVVYDEKNIEGTPRTSRSLFNMDVPTVGGCVAGQIDLCVLPIQDIPRMAEIKLYTRLACEKYPDGWEYSEWIPKGTFFIDTRKLDTESGVLTIHGYDAMLKSEVQFLQEGDSMDWPRASSVIVAQICNQMGVELDARTELDDEIKVPYPNDWTGREILSYIAIAHCGNWTITEAGKLRLVPLWSIPEATHYLVDEFGDPITLGGVRILV